MTHTLIQIPSYLFIINQPKVSFQFLIFQEGFYMVFTSTYHYFYPVTHFETAMGSTPLMVPFYGHGIRTKSCDLE